MEWLAQNWIWLALGIGFVLMLRRGGHGGHGGCCGGGHGSGDGKPAERVASNSTGHVAGHQHR